jgi:hypothetical protein
MGVSRVINRRTAVIGLLLVILATAGFGFAATNTVPESAAGDGAGDISGYVVANIDYTFDTTNYPGVITMVSFDLTPTDATNTNAPENVDAQLDSSGGAWYDCALQSAANAVPFVYDCTSTSNTGIQDADRLRVIAND